MELPSEITLNDVTGKRFVFIALENLQDFLKTEADFWELKDSQSNTGGPSNPYFKIFNSFRNAYFQIESWENVSSWDSVFTKHPAEALALLYAALPSDISAWPYGSEKLLKKIEEAAPQLASDERLVELFRIWNSR